MKLTRAILMLSTALSTPAIAFADPVSAIGLVTLAASSAAAAAVGGGILGALVATAIGVAGTFAKSLFAPSSAKMQAELRTMELSAHPAWRFAFGEFETEGAIVYQYVNGEDLYVAYLLNDGLSDSITSLSLNDVPMTLLSDAENDLTDFSKGAKTNTPPYWDDDVAEFWLADGTQTTWPADFSFVEGGDGNFKTTDTWTGKTILFGKFTFGADEKAHKRWSTGAPPRVKVVLKGMKVYDPRKDGTSGVTGASGSHRPDDDTTWEWSSNPALCALHVIRQNPNWKVADERILIQQFADAADACEVEDGAVSEVLLHSRVWTSGAPAVQTVDPGSGVWTYNRGTVPTGIGTSGGFSGQTVAKMTSTDTDGTLTGDELARMGLYIDMAAEGRSGDVQYLLRRNAVFDGDAPNIDKWRVVVFQADKGGTNSDWATNFLPSDAKNITQVYDSGVVDFDSGGPTPDRDWLVQGDYVSMVLYGGGPNETDIEVGPVELYTTSQGGKQRYRCDGLLKIETDEWSILDGILDSMAGHIDVTAGKIGVRAGAWVAPTDTLSEPIGDAFEYIGREDPGFAKVVPSFISRPRGYEQTDGVAHVLRSGDRTHNLQLSMVREPEQAKRLAKIFGERAKKNRTLTLMVSGQEWGRRVGDRVTVSMPNFARADGIYRIVGWRPITEPLENGALRLRIELTLQEDEAATYGWSSSDYTEPDAATPPDVTPAENAAVAISAEQSDYRNSSGDATPRAKITVTPTARQVSNGGEIIVQFKESSASAWQQVAKSITETTVIVYHEPVSAGVTYDFRARHTSASLGPGPWAETSLTITTATLDFDPADFGTEFA